jgi:hypothetical protein
MEAEAGKPAARAFEGPFVVLMLSLWGDHVAEAIAFGERWTRRLVALV